MKSILFVVISSLIFYIFLINISHAGTFDFQTSGNISDNGTSNLKYTTGDGTVSISPNTGAMTVQAGGGEGGSSGNFALPTAGSISTLTVSFSPNLNVSTLQLGELTNFSTGTYIFTDTTSGTSNSPVSVNASDSTFQNGVHGLPVTLNWSDVSSFTITYSEGSFRTLVDTIVVTVPPDTTAPTISTIVRQTSFSEYTNQDSVVWRVVFDEAVNNVDVNDFTITGTTGTVTDVSSVDTKTYDVTVSGGDMASLNATITLGFNGSQDIDDNAGNALSNLTPTGLNQNTYTIDNTNPTIVEITAVSSPTNDTTPDYIFSTDETGTLSVGGGSGTSTSTNINSTGNITITFTQSDNSTPLTGGTYSSITVTVTDAAGNASNTLTVTSFTIDATAPRITSIVRQSPSTTPTNSDSVSWRITFDETVCNVDATDFTVTGPTGASLDSSTVCGTIYDVTASGGDLGSLDGTVTLGFSGGQNIQDSVGNALTNTTPTGTNNNSFVLDNTAPSFSSSNTANVAENSSMGTNVIDVTADSDSGITYSETGGTGATLFEIHSSNGQITVSNGASLDFEGTNSYTYQVQAEDTAGNTSNQTITISVTAVNESPVLSNMGPSSGNVGFTAGTTAFVRLDTDSNAAASDPELDALNSSSGNYNGATLTLFRNGGTQNEDEFALVGDNAAFSNSANITISSTVIGTVDTSTAGTAVITLNGNATTSLVNTLLHNLAYRNSNSSATGNKTFDIKLDDQNSGSAQGTGSNLSVTVQVTVTIGQIPVIVNLHGDSFTFTEADSATILDQSTSATLTDGDSPANLNSGNLTVMVVNSTTGEDVLSFSSAGGFVNLTGTTAGSNVQVDLDGGGDGYVTVGTLGNNIAAGNTLVVNFNSSAILTKVAVLLGKVTYENSNTNDPTANIRTVRFTVTDETGLTSSAADVSVTVSAVNDDPSITGVPSDLSFTEDTAGNLDLTAVTLSDTDSGSNTIALTLTASAGILTANSGGSVTVSDSNSATLTLTGTVSNIDTYLNTASLIQYTGASNAFGNDAATLTLTANDGGNTGTGGGGNVNIGTVNLDISAVNDAPTLLLGNSNSLQYTAGTQLLFSTQATVADVDNSNFNGGNLAVGFSAPDAITTHDRLGINPVGTNASEIGIDGTNVTYGGTTIGSIAGGIGSTSLTISFNSTSATPAAAQALIRRLTFENTSSSPGSESRVIRIVLDDGAGGSSISPAVSRTVLMNQPPNLSNDTKTTNEDSTLVFAASDLTANDSDPENDTLSVIRVSSANHGSVALTNGTITFTPTQNYHGNASFTYTVSDGQGNQVSGTVTVTVTSVNDTPTITTQTFSVMEGSPSTFTLTASDVDGDSLTFELLSGPTGGGSIGSFAANGSLLYTPPASIVNQTVLNADTFSVRVSDGMTTSEATTVTINVLNNNDPPTALPVTMNAYQNTNNYIQFRSSDPDGDSLNYTITSSPLHGKLFNPSLGGGSVEYAPEAGFTGTDSFTFTVTDGEFTSSPATVNITVLPEPTPTATASLSPTPTITPTQTSTATHTSTPDPNATATPTPTASNTPTITPTPTQTPTNTPRPGNHPPIIMMGTTLPETVALHTPCSVRLYITDEDQDSMALRFADSSLILSQQTASSPGFTVFHFTVDTSIPGKIPIAVFAYDGSDAVSFNIVIPVVDSDPATHTPTPDITNTATPMPTATEIPVIILPTVTPTHTTVPPTHTPTATATHIPAVAAPTATPVPIDITGSFLEVFDNTSSIENLLGGLDFDEAGIRDLVINWTLHFSTETIAAFHVYVQINGDGVFQYLGQSSGNANRFVWTAGSQQVTPAFRQGPQPGNAYAFQIYALTISGTPHAYGPISTNGIVVYDGENANDRITGTALQIYDSVLSTTSITGSTDFDAPINRGLTLAWNLEGIDPAEILEYHIYVRSNRQDRFDFLSRVPNGQIQTLHWTPGNPSITAGFRNGPQLGMFYEFLVYALTASGTPAVYGPITVNGPIQYPAGSVLSSELAAMDFGGVQMQSSVTVTDDLTATTDLSGSTDQDTLGDEALVIRWQTDELLVNGRIVDPDSIRDIHIFVRDNGAPPAYLGRTNNPYSNFFEWRANNGNILTPQFLNGPVSNHEYQFAVYYILEVRDENNHPISFGPLYCRDKVVFNP